MPQPKIRKIIPFAIILLVAILLISPNLLSKSMIMGSDAIFHFNRFYDVAMQIKTGNFQYFVSMFGFQQSGRIVNAFYGPLAAYCHGILVLISGSWFRYQILSNLILYLISGLSMYALLRTNKVKKHISIPVSIIYMTTYAIQYWTIRQGFTSWGACILPLCLIPIRDMVETQRVNKVQLGLFTALMFQTHVFSSFLLVAIYIPFFLYAFIHSDRRRLLVKDLSLAILLFFILTANIWTSLLLLYGGNTILPPFVNHQMYLNTINQNSYYWLITPVTMVVIMVAQALLMKKFYKNSSKINRIAIGTSLFFLALSSSLVPWKYLVEQKYKFAELIQFPFRFMIPFIVLFLFSFSMTLEENPINKKRTMGFLVSLTVISVGHIVSLTSFTLVPWLTKNISYYTQTHTVIKKEKSDKIKKSFYDSDLSLSLSYWEKSTPDYLPIYKETKENKYYKYEDIVINPTCVFSKSVKDGKIIVEWEDTGSNTVNVPVFSYKYTNLVLNGKKDSENTIELSSFGSPIVTQKAGLNTLTLEYEPIMSFHISLILTAVSWFGTLAFSLFKRIKKYE